MALASYHHDFKLFLEGVKIDTWEGAALRTAVNAGTSADFSIPDDGTLYPSFVPGVRVAFFMKFLMHSTSALQLHTYPMETLQVH